MIYFHNLHKGDYLNLHFKLFQLKIDLGHICDQLKINLRKPSENRVLNCYVWHVNQKG